MVTKGDSKRRGAQATGAPSVIAYGKTYVLAALIILSLIPLLLVRQTKGARGAHAILE